MTVRINKPAINLREKLAELDKPSGLTGEELLRSQTSEEARNSLDLEEHLFENFESTGIDDNATSTKVTVSDSGVDVTGTVTADGLEIDKGGIGETASFSGDNVSGARALQFISSTTTNLGDTHSINAQSSTGVLNLATNNNTKRVTVQPNGDVSFYEDTGTTAKFVWDASAESLGIGTASPSRALHVNSGSSNECAIFESTDTEVTLALKDSTGTSEIKCRNDFRFNSGGTERLRIDSSGNVGIGTNPLFGHRLSVQAVNDKNFTVDDNNGTGISLNAYNNSGGNIELAVKSNVFSIHSPTAERMRIDSSGNLLVGKTATGSGVDGFSYVASASATQLSRTSGDALSVNRNSTDGAITVFRKDGSTVGSINTSGGGLSFNSSGSQVVLSASGVGYHLDSTTLRTFSGNDGNVDLGLSSSRFKDLYLSGGVYLGGTGSANKLDDYEEGTFTPTVFGASTAGTGTYTTQSGRYTKIGNKVFIEIVLAWSAHTGSGGMRLNGLPFNTHGFRQTFEVTFENLTYSGIPKVLNFGSNNSVLQFFQQNSGAGLSLLNLDTSVSYMVITGSYETNS